jgi:5S rRNA maturation endonuclease (ribonuclease M5)
LPELIAAGKDGQAAIFMTEGEKDCDNVRKLGYTATSFKNWNRSFNTFISGAEVIILADHDASGIQQADNAANMLREVAASVKIIDLYKNEPIGQKNGKDVSD